MVVKVRPTVITVLVIILDRMKDFECSFENIDESVGLLITYRCNLDCKYCYIHKKQERDMSLEMAQSILEPFLMKESGMLNIIFVGGETLLAIDVIRPLVEWIEKGKWNRSYRLFGSTNGTLLTPELKEWLKAHKNLLTLGLSYDGLPSVQSLNRSNDSIDIEFFINTWPRQPIQMTINSESVCQMAGGVIYLLEKGAVVHPNVAFEENEWLERSIFEYGRQLYKLALFYNKHDDLPPITQFIHDLNMYADNIGKKNPQYEICGAGNGYQVFDTNGHSYPCHILSPLVLKGDKLQEVEDGLISKTTDFADPECLTCPYSAACPTCIACNFLYRNKLQKRDKTHCEIMKTEVRAFIKKEVLRLTAKSEITPEDAAEIDSINKLVEYEGSRRI